MSRHAKAHEEVESYSMPRWVHMQTLMKKLNQIQHRHEATCKSSRMGWIRFNLAMSRHAKAHEGLGSDSTSPWVEMQSDELTCTGSWIHLSLVLFYKISMISRQALTHFSQWDGTFTEDDTCEMRVVTYELRIDTWYVWNTSCEVRHVKRYM